MWPIFLSLALYCLSALAQTQVWETGFSDQYKSENTLGEYTFGYNEDHTTGGSFRRETSDRFGNKVGSYGLRIGDGRVRIVNYVADGNGFRADVVSNEPGMESQQLDHSSKITKQNIYSVLVPGFRYSPAVPYVTVENHQRMGNLQDGVMGETGDGFEQEVGSYDDESYGSIVEPNGNDGNVFLNEGHNFNDISREKENVAHAFYAGEEESHGDSFLEGDYSHRSETTFQNGTSSSQMMQEASEVSSSTEKEIEDLTTTAAPALTVHFDAETHASQESSHQSTPATEELKSFQSSVAFSKIEYYDDHKNSTLENSTIHTNGNSTESSATARS